MMTPAQVRASLALLTKYRREVFEPRGLDGRQAQGRFYLEELNRVERLQQACHLCLVAEVAFTDPLRHEEGCICMGQAQTIFGTEGIYRQEEIAKHNKTLKV